MSTQPSNQLGANQYSLPPVKHPNIQEQLDTADTLTIRSDSMKPMQPVTSPPTQNPYSSLPLGQRRKQKLADAMRKYGDPENSLMTRYLPDGHPYHGIPPAEREVYFRSLMEYTSTHGTFSRVTTRDGGESGWETVQGGDVSEEKVERAVPMSVSSTPQRPETREEKAPKTFWGSIRDTFKGTVRLPFFDGAATLPTKLKTVGKSFGRRKKQTEAPKPVMSKPAMLKQRRSTRPALSADTFKPPAQASEETSDRAAIASMERRLPVLVHHRRAPDAGHLKGPARMSDMIVRAPGSIISTASPELVLAQCREEVQVIPPQWAYNSLDERSRNTGSEIKPRAKVNEHRERYLSATWPRARTNRATEAPEYTAGEHHREVIQPSLRVIESGASTRATLRADRGEPFLQTAANVQQRLWEIDAGVVRQLETQKRQRNLMAMLSTEDWDRHVKQPQSTEEQRRVVSSPALASGCRTPEDHGSAQIHTAPSSITAMRSNLRHVGNARLAISVSDPDPSGTAGQNSYQNISSSTLSPGSSSNTSPQSSDGARRVAQLEHMDDEPLSVSK